MFSDALFESLAGLTQEQLYENGITLIDELECEKTLNYQHDVIDYKATHKNDIEQLMLITGEMYRRDMSLTTAYDKFPIPIFLKQFLEGDCCTFCGSGKNIDYTFGESPPIHGTYIFTSHNLLCNKCFNIHDSTQTSLTIGENESYIGVTRIDNLAVLEARQVSLYGAIVQKLRKLKKHFNQKLQELRVVKELMLNIIKTPILTKKLEECLDEILDLNGNKISQLKPHLTEEQYRFVRSGTKFEEFTDQEDLLTRFTTILSDLRKPYLSDL